MTTLEVRKFGLASSSLNWVCFQRAWLCENPFDYTNAIVNVKGNKVSLHCQTYTSALSYDDGVMSNQVTLTICKEHTDLNDAGR